MRILLLLLGVALLASCGDDSSTATSSATAPMLLTELLEIDEPTAASVMGYVVIDSTGARLCEVLAESFPPQCGGVSVAITNPEALTIALESAQSVQWTDVHVRIDGNYDGTDFTASG